MIYTCDITGITKEVKDGKRAVLPRGWKRHNGRLYSDTAWHNSYVMRAVTIPVCGVEDVEWKEFAKHLHDSWTQVTRLCNWMMTTLYAADCLTAPVDPKTGKLPAMQRQYLYPQTAAIAPDVMSQNRSAIEQSIQGLYRSDRFAIRARNNKSLRSYRYPQPLPIVSAVWRFANDDKTSISLPMMGQRFTIRLRKNAGSARAIAALGTGVPTELSLLAKSIGEPQGLPSVNIRDHHGQNVRHCVMCKIALWVPRITRERTGTLRVRTDSDSLLVALNEKDEKLWMYHADHIRRMVAERSRRVNRESDDRKFEQRQPVASFQTRSECEVDRYRRKMDSITHEIAAQLVSYADRRKFAVIEYNDSDHRFVDRFPYHELKSKIQQKCERLGISFLAGLTRKETEESQNV